MSQTAAPAIATFQTQAIPAAAVARVQVKLNTFQRLMRLWNELAPYNAGQIMEVSGEANEESLQRWRAAAEAVVAETGLGRPTFDEMAGRVEFKAIPFVAIDRIARTDCASLENHVNEELNRPFGKEELPIRFFIMPSEAPGAGRRTTNHYFGAIYDHWVADSRAMRELMQRIFLRYQGHGGGILPPLTLQAPDFQTLFGRRIGRLWRCVSLRESARNLIRHRRAFRVNLRDPLDFTARVIYRRLPDALIGRIHQWTKANQASVNDAFLAALGQAMGQFTAEGRYRKRQRRFHLQRDRVGLGTIVDIRDAASEPLDRVFGLYLSSYTVVLEKPELMPMAELTQSIAARTQKIKRSNSMVRGFVALATARTWWGLFTKSKWRALLFHKNVPTTAGISNVNMTGSWVDPTTERGERGEGEDATEVRDYLRVSPTGPLLPMALTLTTIGSRLSLFVTYRTTAFTKEEAEGIVSDFVRKLSEACT